MYSRLVLVCVCICMLLNAQNILNMPRLKHNDKGFFLSRIRIALLSKIVVEETQLLINIKVLI